MSVFKFVDILLVKYQAHLFIVITYYAFKQFQMSKNLEIHIEKCNGRFKLSDLKQAQTEKKIDEIKVDIKDVKNNKETRMTLS